MTISRENFLEPEVRCGHEVTVEVKKLWKVQLDMLEEFMRICRKYDLRWQMNGGSLIGAMRHQGYIPWDDDLDVIMPRADYEKFAEVVQAELPEPYVYVNDALEPEDSRGHAKIRNSNTAWLDTNRLVWKSRCNQGIFIDIIPTDDVPKDMKKRVALLKKYAFRKELIKYTARRIIGSPMARCRKLIVRIGSTIATVLQGGHVRAVNKTEDVIRKYKFAPDEERMTGLATWCSLFKQYEKGFFRGEDVWGELIEVPFEYLMVKVPKAYDTILTTSFGDWRTPVKSPAYHGVCEYDTEHSYKEVLKSKYGYTDHDFEQNWF